MIKKILRFSCYILLFFAIVVIMCEIWYRIEPRQPRFSIWRRKLTSRLWFEWLNKENVNPLLPPFKIFSNTDFDNIERLRFIAKETSLPKNTKLKAYDFLRPKEIREKTYYAATINNLGFRDPPRTVQKPKNVFRIIVLGSYDAFGHALNDEDTYPSQLEHVLNNLKVPNIIFEVWNGGRHASSAIVGLARLRTEILNYKPDLIIWDYGFVDHNILGDNNFPVVFFLPDFGVYRSISRFFQLTKNIIAGKSILIMKVMDYLLKINKKRNVEAFAEVNKKMLEITQENNIPVILLRVSLLSAALPPEFYQRLVDHFKHAIFIDVKEIFKKYPPRPDAVTEFHSSENWNLEFDFAFWKEPRWQPNEYFQDIFHYNKWGNRAISIYLADQIIDLVKN